MLYRDPHCSVDLAAAAQWGLHMEGRSVACEGLAYFVHKGLLAWRSPLNKPGGVLRIECCRILCIPHFFLLVYSPLSDAPALL